MDVREVELPRLAPARLAPTIGHKRHNSLEAGLADLRRVLSGRTLWHVNSTAEGGGVAEMLHFLLGYMRGAGIDARWLAIGGDRAFFDITKRLDNGLSGTDGDGGHLDKDARSHLEAVGEGHDAALRGRIRTGDVVILHDPQTATLVPPLRGRGARVIWRGHNGTDHSNSSVDRSWAFLRPYLVQADALVFTRKEFVPCWLAEKPVYIIPPCLDPFTPKNQELSAETVQAILGRVGLIAPTRAGSEAVFTRRDGTTGGIEIVADVIRAGPPAPSDAPMAVQVSRWDRVKDMLGVMRGIAEHADLQNGVHLALVGPDVNGVADDPEAEAALNECIQTWRSLPTLARAQIELVCLPMDDPDENAAVVNAIQRHAALVVQKSISEGFGLTVTEAMWKARPIVASAVGGIQDQIIDEQNGVLLHDPHDVRSLGTAVNDLITDSERRTGLGYRARQGVIDRYLSDRHLRDEAAMVHRVLCA